MFSFHRMRQLLFSAFLLASVPSTAFAARSADYYLKIEDLKGEVRIVRCPDGICTVTGLAPGKYMVSVCDAKGADVTTEGVLTHTVLSAREASSGMATGRMASPTAGGEATSGSAISAPRDAMSGQASGKRMHKPFLITKTWDRRLPENMIDVVEAGSTVTLELKATVNTTRSNIKRPSNE